MQSTGQGSRHLSQPLQSSGMMMTSIPWLKMAPNCGGQCRMHVSQLMQIDMSISSGGVFQLRVRPVVARRSPGVPAAIGTEGNRLDLPAGPVGGALRPVDEARRLAPPGL